MPEKEELGNNIPKVYDPQSFEKKWYEFWEKNKFFHAEVDKSKKPYSMVIPPPNVTGQLHMGHALDNTLQDILIRYHRMQGYNTVWIPGCDHAGIATQAKVEGKLREEGMNRYELGREKFLERVWDWKEKFGSRIMFQLRSLGSSLDWDRERFTMDEAAAVPSVRSSSASMRRDSSTRARASRTGARRAIRPSRTSRSSMRRSRAISGIYAMR